MDLEKQLAALARYATPSTLNDVIARPALYSPEPFTSVLPSIVIGPDGPTLARLLLVSDNYICDVTPGDQRDTFDFVSKKTLFNYRFAVWDHHIAREGQDELVYQIAQIVLIHTESFTTTLDYAGDSDDRNSWINSVLAALPISGIL